MKSKLMVLILFVATVSWAQTPTQTKSDSTDSQKPVAAEKAPAKTDCPCCQKMADSKDAKPCCHHDSAAKGENSAMACCSGKDGASCMKGDKDKSASAACANGKCCGGDQKDCCAKSDKTTEQAAMECYGGGSGEHCGMAHHEPGDMAK